MKQKSDGLGTATSEEQVFIKDRDPAHLNLEGKIGFSNKSLHCIQR